MDKLLIAPSILSADFSKMGEDVKRLTNEGADFIHVDVMDGHFVPNITFGPKMVKDIRKTTTLSLDVHLMISNPFDYIDQFATAGADYITIHIEANGNVVDTLNKIKGHNVKCGLVISPDTEVSNIEPYLHMIDMCLVMSVYPGFGGQKFLDRVLPKVRRLKELKEENDYSYLIEIDGGINNETVKLAKEAGVEVCVAGNAVFTAPSMKEAIIKLKNC